MKNDLLRCCGEKTERSPNMALRGQTFIEYVRTCSRALRRLRRAAAGIRAQRNQNMEESTIPCVKLFPRQF